MRAGDIDSSFVPLSREDIATAALEGEAVLYDERTGDMHLLNATAALIWAGSDGSHTVDELVDDLGKAYGVEPGAIAVEVIDLVRQLGRQGLLDDVTPEAAG